MARHKELEVEVSKAYEIPEIGSPEAIETVRAEDFKTAAELEAFMQEKLTIVVNQTAEQGKTTLVLPQVNGINQPIPRGVKVNVKRKYVEALLRNKKSRYEQQIPNPMTPEKKTMREVSALEEPFVIVYDPNPKGRAWAEAIMAER